MEDIDLSKLKIEKTTIKKRSPVRILFYMTLIISTIGAAGVLYMYGFLSLPVSVEVYTVSKIYPSQNITLLNASGYIAAQRKSAVASKVTGRIIELFVEEGVNIKKGQLIAKLENDDVLVLKAQAEANINLSIANIELAKAELKDATLDYDRNKKLIAAQAISRSQYDLSESRYQKAIASLSAAEASKKVAYEGLQSAMVALEYTLVKAPFDAVVLTKNADIGDIVTPVGAASNAKAAVVTIADLNSLQVEVDVSETNLALIKLDQFCEISLDAIPNTRFMGKVHMIVPTVDRSKASILVKVRFIDIDARMLPDMSAKVAFLSRPLSQEEQSPCIAVHKDVLLHKNSKHFVFLIRENYIKEIPVICGNKLWNLIEIRQGLNAGDKLVLKPLSSLKDGNKIKISGQ